MPLLEQPGRWWRYGTACSVLGVLLARADGRGLPEVLRERVTRPLGMGSTGFHPEPDRAGRLVDCLVWDGEGPPGVLDPGSGSAWSQPPTFPDGAGGLLGTVDDGSPSAGRCWTRAPARADRRGGCRRRRWRR